MTIAIPSYKPDQKLIETVAMLQEKTSYGIVVVDDGSGDPYRRFFDDAQALGCTVLRHDVNRGKGAALKTAFAWVAEHCPGDSLVCADSDGQQKVEDILRVAEAVVPGNREIVLGIRMFEGKVPFRSRFGNWFMRHMFRTITRVSLYDTQNGLRGYPASLLPWLMSVGGNRFEYETNMLLHARRAGVAFREVRIQTIYENNNEGSHYRPVRDSLRIGRCIWNYLRKAS